MTQNVIFWNFFGKCGQEVTSTYSPCATPTPSPKDKTHRSIDLVTWQGRAYSLDYYLLDAVSHAYVVDIMVLISPV